MTLKRDCNSFRSLKWIQRNSLDNPSCVSYVVRLCEIEFGFSNFDIKPFDNEDNSLWLSYGLYSYIIGIDKDNICLKVLEKNTNNIHKDRYHLLNKTFVGDACWYECFGWIKKRSIF